MKSEKKTKRGNLSSSTKFALTVHRTHHIIIQLFRGSEWNSVFIGLNPAQAIFLKLPLKKSFREENHIYHFTLLHSCDYLWGNCGKYDKWRKQYAIEAWTLNQRKFNFLKLSNGFSDFRMISGFYSSAGYNIWNFSVMGWRFQCHGLEFHSDQISIMLIYSASFMWLPIARFCLKY